MVLSIHCSLHVCVQDNRRKGCRDSKMLCYMAKIRSFSKRVMAGQAPSEEYCICALSIIKLKIDNVEGPACLIVGTENYRVH